MLNEINQAHAAEGGLKLERDEDELDDEYEAFYKPGVDFAEMKLDDQQAFNTHFKKIDKNNSNTIDKEEWIEFISEASGLG